MPTGSTELPEGTERKDTANINRLYIVHKEVSF